MYTYIFIYIHEESKGEIGKKHVKGKIRTENLDSDSLHTQTYIQTYILFTYSNSTTRK